MMAKGVDAAIVVIVGTSVAVEMMEKKKRKAISPNLGLLVMVVNNDLLSLILLSALILSFSFYGLGFMGPFLFLIPLFYVFKKKV
jgi:hypothetical protein